MSWPAYVLEFVGGALLANGVPHFTQGVAGRRFPTPFASPPAVGESSPLTNVLWGFGNFAAGAALLCLLRSRGRRTETGWAAIGAGALVAATGLACYFGKLQPPRD
jgi:hypothetical protein